MKLIHFPFAVFNRLRVEVNLTKTFKRSKLINCIAKNQYENYLIRGATIYDLEQLKKIYRQLNKGEFSKTHIKLLTKCPEKLLLVAEKKVNSSTEIVGMDMFYINPRDFKQKTVHEGFIGVLPDYEGQGIATQMRKDAIRHFNSSVYKTPGTEHCDESEFINLVANQLGVVSNQIEPKVEDIPTEHEKMIWAMENPPESTCMSGWHTFMKVKQQGVKVTLDGQGADEQVAGYFIYIPSYLMSLPLASFYAEFFKFLQIPGAQKTVLISFLMAHFRALFGEKIYQATFHKIKGRAAPAELNAELKNSIETGLVTLIHYSDHVSVGHGVESRMPFLDYRLVEYLATIPAAYKLHNGWTKYLARITFASKLPEAVTWRKDKMGWPIPEEHWFNGEHKKWIQQQILNSTTLPRLEEPRRTQHALQSTPEKSTMLKIVRRLNIRKVFG